MKQVGELLGPVFDFHHMEHGEHHPSLFSGLDSFLISSYSSFEGLLFYLFTASIVITRRRLIVHGASHLWPLEESSPHTNASISIEFFDQVKEGA